MAPITFTCRATVPFAPRQIADQILDLANWPQFQGYGPLPGIQKAAFEIRTPDIVGTRIQVTNTDGSRHMEEITVWQPDHHLQLQMKEFSPPLSYLATSFIEDWRFESSGSETQVVRSMQIHCRSVFTKLPMRLIAVLLKKAISRQLQQMQSMPAAVML